MFSFSCFDIFAIKVFYRLHLMLCCFLILFPPFTSCINHCLCDFLFLNNFISSFYLCSCCFYIFLLWFSSNHISWLVWVFCSNVIFVCLYLLYASSIYLVPVFTASGAGSLLVLLYVEGFFIFHRNYWSWFFVHFVKFHLNIVTDCLNGSYRVVIIYFVVYNNHNILVLFRSFL